MNAWIEPLTCFKKFDKHLTIAQRGTNIIKNRDRNAQAHVKKLINYTPARLSRLFTWYKCEVIYSLKSPNHLAMSHDLPRQLPVHPRQRHQLLFRRSVHVHELRVIFRRRQIERMAQTGLVQFASPHEPPKWIPAAALAPHGARTLPHIVTRHFEIKYRS